MITCCKCLHFMLNGDPVWYNAFCRATPRERAIDPVFGQVRYKGVTDLGNTYYTGDKYFNCSHVNTAGRCQKWEPRSASILPLEAKRGVDWPDITE